MNCLYCDKEVQEDKSKALGEYGLVLCLECSSLPEFDPQEEEDYGNNY